MRFICFTTFFLLSYLLCNASSSASFKECSWTTESGNMILHTDLDVHDCKNQNLTVVAYFYNADGSKLADTNDSFCTTDGQVAAHTKIKPKYDNSHYSDLTISIPISELHPLPGKNDYYVNFKVYKGDETIGSEKKGVTFSNTGNSNSSAHSHADKFSQSTTRACTICHGTGKTRCVICSGTGNDPIPKPNINPFTHMITYYYTKCMMCGATGYQICCICHGTGEGPDYNYQNSNGGSGTPYFGNPGYGSGTGSSSSSSSSSRVTCSRCGGSGVCKSCGNTGGRWEYVDDYTGSGAKSFINCGECNGRRQCPICYGRGYL